MFMTLNIFFCFFSDNEMKIGPKALNSVYRIVPLAVALEITVLIKCDLQRLLFLF